MSNVITFPGVEEEITADEVLENTKGKVLDCIVIGWDADGNLHVSGTMSGDAEVISLLEIGKAAFVHELIG